MIIENQESRNKFTEDFAHPPHTHTQMENLDVNVIVYGASFPTETKNIYFSSHEQSDIKASLLLNVHI